MLCPMPNQSLQRSVLHQLFFCDTAHDVGFCAICTLSQRDSDKGQHIFIYNYYIITDISRAWNQVLNATIFVFNSNWISLIFESLNVSQHGIYMWVSHCKLGFYDNNNYNLANFLLFTLWLWGKRMVTKVDIDYKRRKF